MQEDLLTKRDVRNVNEFVDDSGTRVAAAAHSMQKLLEQEEIERMLRDAGFKEVVLGFPLLHTASDVPECSGNIFFAACS